MSKHNNKVYLGHIFDSIEKIERFVADSTFAQFKNDEKTIDSVIRNFEVIGEASNNLSVDFMDSHSNIDFHPAIDFRNRLIHGYDDISLENVWSTIKNDLPKLKSQIEDLK